MRSLRARELDLFDPPSLEPPATPLDCGCTLSEPRQWCPVHGGLLDDVLTVWSAAAAWDRRAIWQEADGLGVRGHVPASGRSDLTALRSATPASVERMWQVAHDLGPLD